MSDFTHLHLHTQYSILDGAIKIKDLFPAIKEMGMNSVAITDHGNLFGAIDFYQTALKHNIKPIIGCEVYVAGEKGMLDRSERIDYHLVLLAKNNIGYKNLVYLVSMAHVKGKYYHPRIDKPLLAKHSEGLIGLSACLGGELPKTILSNNSLDLPLAKAKELRSLFAADDFYLELQENGLPEQKKVNQGLQEISEQMNIPMVATNDCHYMTRQDHFAHEVLMCVQTGKRLTDTDRLSHSTDQFYLKPPQEMAQAFAHIPETIENTCRIADQCNLELDLKSTHLPKFQVPAGMSESDYLRKVAVDGFKKRLKQRPPKTDKKVYRQRLEHELEVIIRMGFSGYFLIVWDFIAHAKNQGIKVGPGRGSGAGSLVAYSMGITDLDPLPYDLLFERFLNTERVSMPDFDIDFCKKRRQEVITYVTEKYGTDNVGQIINHTKLKARSVIRDVGRVLDVPLNEVDVLAKLVPIGANVTLNDALESEPQLQKMMTKNKKYQELIELALKLEHLNRYPGMHAAGIVIGDKPLWEYAPLFMSKDDKVMTQFDKKKVELTGLVKFDFLGLKTLTLIDEAVQLINRGQSVDKQVDIDAIPLNDPKVYQFLTGGNTLGVFQLESLGFQSLMKNLKPDRFEDLIAAVALHRPGPLKSGYVDRFCDCKHGRAEITYAHPLLEDILEETYGVIVYQEQVMKLVQVLAGFSLGKADIVRRAMGKKDKAEMDAQRQAFLEGAQAQQINVKLAKEIFANIEKFAEYGFNKSHSAAYALISYQTAYLKTYFPVELMTALLSMDMDRSDKLMNYLNETRKMGIKILPADVNKSGWNFDVENIGEKKAIRFGLGAIKNVGEKAVKSIEGCREKEGNFRDLFDLCQRVDLRTVNRRVIESLTKAGCFDFSHFYRSRIFQAVNKALEIGNSLQKEKQNNQMDLFSLMAKDDREQAQIDYSTYYPDIEKWDFQERLINEKEVLGYFLSGHPMESYQQEVEKYHNQEIASLSQLKDRSPVVICGFPALIKHHTSARGNKMAFITLEDLSGRVEVLVFKKVFEKYRDLLSSLNNTGEIKTRQESQQNNGPPRHSNLFEILIINGTLMVDEQKRDDASEDDGADGPGGEKEKSKVVKVRAQEIITLSSLRSEKTAKIVFELPCPPLNESPSDVLNQLKQLLEIHHGSCPIEIKMDLPDIGTIYLTLPNKYKACPTDDLIFQANKLFDCQVTKMLE